MLKGCLCTVRHVQSTDLTSFIGLVNDLPSRGDYFISHFTSPETMRKEFMQTAFVTEERESFLIEDQEHRIVGAIQHFKGRTRAAREIGYRLFDSAIAGRGYISEATAMLVDYLFRAYEYHRLELLMDPDNAASERIAQKCGFTHEGTLREAMFVNGAMRDLKIYGLLRREWEARQRG